MAQDPNEPAYFGVKKPAISAWVRLNEAMEDLTSYPCKENPDEYFDEEIFDEDIAENLCAGCPLLKLCFDFAVLNEEKYGVWGGINFADEDNKKNGKLF